MHTRNMWNSFREGCRRFLKPFFCRCSGNTIRKFSQIPIFITSPLSFFIIVILFLRRRRHGERMRNHPKDAIECVLWHISMKHCRRAFLMDPLLFLGAGFSCLTTHRVQARDTMKLAIRECILIRGWVFNWKEIRIVSPWAARRKSKEKIVWRDGF